jgi:hypothetical protein
MTTNNFDCDNATRCGISTTNGGKCAIPYDTAKCVTADNLAFVIG